MINLKMNLQYVKKLMKKGEKMEKRHFLKFLLTTLVASLTILFATASFAMTPPDQVVKQTISGALQELNQRREEFTADKNELYVAIERHLQPAVHFERISRLVMAKHWRKATKEQQIEFIHYFKKTLLNTYASAIFEYSGEEIIYKPYKNEGKDKVKIVTEFVTQSSGRVPVIYSMSNRKDDKWRAYDIKIVLDGASTSLVQLYKSQFNSIIAKHGIQGMIDRLKQKNS